VAKILEKFQEMEYDFYIFTPFKTNYEIPQLFDLFLEHHPTIFS